MGQHQADGGAFSRARVDGEVSARHGGTVAHARETEAGQGIAVVGSILEAETAAVVRNAQADFLESREQVHLHTFGPAVFEGIVDGFLQHRGR